MGFVTETTGGAAPTPLVIADGGSSAEAPDHTIAAFELALEQGADGLAMGVHLSRDNQPIVIRDSALERTTDGAGAVRNHTVRELKRLDAGGWWGKRFRGQRLQTLQEMFERFRGRTRFWIELAGDVKGSSDIEERVVSLIEVYDVVDRSLLQSLDTAILDRARSLNGEIRLARLIAQAEQGAISTDHGSARAVCLPIDLLSEAATQAILTSQLECYVRMQSEPAHVDRLANWSIAGIITDRPGPVRARLGRQP